MRATFAAVSSSVDLPMPGSRQEHEGSGQRRRHQGPTRIRRMPVVMRACCSSSMSAYRRAAPAAPASAYRCGPPSVPRRFCGRSSTIAFHAPQSPQRPSHFATANHTFLADKDGLRGLRHQLIMESPAHQVTNSPLFVDSLDPRSDPASIS